MRSFSFWNSSSASRSTGVANAFLTSSAWLSSAIPSLDLSSWDSSGVDSELSLFLFPSFLSCLGSSTSIDAAPLMSIFKADDLFALLAVLAAIQGFSSLRLSSDASASFSLFFFRAFLFFFLLALVGFSLEELSSSTFLIVPSLSSRSIFPSTLIAKPSAFPNCRDDATSFPSGRTLLVSAAEATGLPFGFFFESLSSSSSLSVDTAASSLASNSSSKRRASSFAFFLWFS
mmetsp:Transcript_27455/g.44641  ORF Transcript_27455/g.44641 Transcript_27455/m.44641 type:complete len:231 (+) Transcript_27455:486-1178(+)